MDRDRYTKYMKDVILSNEEKNQSEYIHFKSPEECQKFKDLHVDKYNFGNTCCSGKGLKILNVDSDDMYFIRKNWKKYREKFELENKIENLRRKRAARIIKEAWTKYAWDPQFSICRRLYIKRMENIGVNYED